MVWRPLLHRLQMSTLFRVRVLLHFVCVLFSFGGRSGGVVVVEEERRVVDRRTGRRWAMLENDGIASTVMVPVFIPAHDRKMRMSVTSRIH